MCLCVCVYGCLCLGITLRIIHARTQGQWKAHVTTEQDKKKNMHKCLSEHVEETAFLISHHQHKCQDKGRSTQGEHLHLQFTDAGYNGLQPFCCAIMALRQDPPGFMGVSITVANCWPFLLHHTGSKNDRCVHGLMNKEQICRMTTEASSLQRRQLTGINNCKLSVWRLRN